MEPITTVIDQAGNKLTGGAAVVGAPKGAHAGSGFISCLCGINLANEKPQGNGKNVRGVRAVDLPD